MQSNDSTHRDLLRQMRGEFDPDTERAMQERAEGRHVFSAAEIRAAAEKDSPTSTSTRVSQQHPPRGKRCVVQRDGIYFTATPCYGMHAPWWVVKVSNHPADDSPVLMIEDDDVWWTLDGFEALRTRAEKAEAELRTALGHLEGVFYPPAPTKDAHGYTNSHPGAKAYREAKAYIDQKLQEINQ